MRLSSGVIFRRQLVGASPERDLPEVICNAVCLPLAPRRRATCPSDAAHTDSAESSGFVWTKNALGVHELRDDAAGALQLRGVRLQLQHQLVDVPCAGSELLLCSASSRLRTENVSGILALRRNCSLRPAERLQWVSEKQSVVEQTMKRRR